MFTKPFHITLTISLTVLFVMSFALLILSDKAIWYTISVAFISSGVVFIVAQLLLDKYIYNRIRILFNKVLNITYEKRVLKLLEDPFELYNARIDSYLEEEEEKNDMLYVQQRFRREYIGNIAHELKTPIFTIQGYISTLLDGGLYDEKINTKYLKRADRGVDRILDLLEDLDLITKLDSGEFPLEIETFDILQLTKEVFESQELKAKEKSISFSFLGYPKKQIFVDADRKRIFQVLSNLIVNAIKYGKVNGRVTIDFNSLSEDHLLIEIIDTGIGISNEDLLRIFERFYRVDKSGGRKLGGSGLGLSIVKHIVEAHGQTLNVNSVQGKGSTFSFTLKLA